MREQKYQEQTTDKAIKPIYPLRHEFVASLDQYLQRTGMLIDIVGQLLEHDQIKAPRVKEMVQEHYDKCRLARMGESG